MSHPESEIHIDRLALRVAGLDEDAARALARLVAEGLAPGMLRVSGMTHVDFLRVDIQADTRDSTPDQLSRRIVDKIGRVLARDRVSGGPDAEAVE